MDIQAIIFDVDGTVAETADLHRAAYNRAFQEHGLSWHWDREIYSQLVPVEFTLSKLRLFASAVRQSGRGHAPSATELAQIAALKARAYCHLLRQGRARLRPGVARLMKEAQHAGMALGAVSTSTRAETQALLSVTLGFHGMGWFSSLKTAENANIYAPERSLYQAVLDDFCIDGARAVAIDDSASGAEGSARCGLSCVITPSLYTASNRFNPDALVLSDLGEPAAPFTEISGELDGYSYVTPTLIRAMARPKAAAA